MEPAKNKIARNGHRAFTPHGVTSAALVLFSVIIIGLTFLYGAAEGKNPREALTVSTGRAYQSLSNCYAWDFKCQLDEWYANIVRYIADDYFFDSAGAAGDNGDSCDITPDECWDKYQFCIEICDERYRDPSQGTEHALCVADCSLIWYSCQNGIPPGCAG